MKQLVTFGVGERDRMIFLPTRSAKIGRVESRLRVVRVQSLTVERHPPLARRTQSCINMARARNEAMEFEGKKGAVAGAASLTGGPAHQCQHALDLEPAALFRLVVSSLNRLAASAIVIGGRRSSR